MSAFKDAVLNDISNVFFNVDEFAEKHYINDQDVFCIVDKDITKERNQTMSNYAEGVFIDSVVIYVRCRDIENKPVEGELLYLDDIMYIVRSVNVESGILVILAEVHNQ